MSAHKKIVFLTGTRADFGKLKSLMTLVQSSAECELHVFATGMHMLSKYGYTCSEIEKSGFRNVYKYINQNESDSMDHILSKTVTGLSDYVKEIKPDLIIVHGDRVEALAGAIVGSLNNIIVGHIEGGEVSGTIDELIRHAVTKLSHVHFVANDVAYQRLIQLGEIESHIHVIGSPDVDIMNSSELPSIGMVKERYEFEYDDYAILMFHPVTTELENLQEQIKTIVDTILETDKNYVVIYPNNDHGTNDILAEYKRLLNNSRFKVIPSMRFEYFITLLKSAKFIIGNSSAGVREAPHFGVPAINLGTRQNNRVVCETVLNSEIEKKSIIDAIARAVSTKRNGIAIFGDGGSDKKFIKLLGDKKFWSVSKQKAFVDKMQ